MKKILVYLIIFQSIAFPSIGFSDPSGVKVIELPVQKQKITTTKNIRLNTGALNTLLQDSLIAAAKKGGWGSSGGGSGVACFNDIEAAGQAEQRILNGLPLTLELKNKLVSLQTLDFWEWSQNKKFSLINSNINYSFVLKDLEKHLSIRAPIFLYKLNQTSQIIETADWTNKIYLPRIFDAKPSYDLPKACRIVQLAARYITSKYEVGGTNGNGPAVYAPLAKIELDADLFERLDPLNQAILIIHEQVYFMAQTVGHKRSDEIRPLVMRLFENKMDDPQWELRGVLINKLGDYALYFGENFKIDAQLDTQESRFNSFYEMLQHIRENIGVCAKKNRLPKFLETEDQKRAMMACKDEAMNPFENQKWFTDEMAFLYMSYFIFDISMSVFNAEHIIAPIKEKDLQLAAQKEIKLACQRIVNDMWTPGISELIGKATAYCRHLKN